MQQLILTLIFYALVVGIFTMVFLMWRMSSKRAAKLEQTLIDVALRSAETSRRLAAILEAQEKEHPP